jgi:hypothetical protein
MGLPVPSVHTSIMTAFIMDDDDICLFSATTICLVCQLELSLNEVSMNF